MTIPDFMANPSFTIWTSGFRGNAQNKLYRDRRTIASAEDLAEACKADHTSSTFVNSERSIANFIRTDVLAFDLDNTHSEDPEAWKTLDDIEEAFEYDVAFYYCESRNHMKVKTKGGRIYEARPKYHLYFPLSEPIETYQEAEFMKKCCACLFPFFDLAALSPAQFFFGVEKPVTGFIDGDYCIDEFIKC